MLLLHVTFHAKPGTREMFVKRTDKDGMEILQNKVSTDSEEEEETED